MNRTILTVAGRVRRVESAAGGFRRQRHGAAGVGGVAAVMLRRDSAATRHLVWLLAIVAMLVVPVLSAMLPQWRVLPEWAGISPRAGRRRQPARLDRQARRWCC